MVDDDSGVRDAGRHDPDRRALMTEPTRCPCASGDTVAACCGPLLDGAPAPTAERLMRSRYTAFVREDGAYLLRTWHPETRPETITFEADLETSGSPTTTNAPG